MTFDEQRLYDLLPAIYRIRDAERVGDPDRVPPLKALLTIIAEQARVIEENLAQGYDDQFVETCAQWVVPYLGDLIGITGLPSAGLEALNPRAEVAHTIGYRRRKGTAAMLEQLARDITNWPARAVEFFQLLATTQFMNHLRPENHSFISVRGAERLEFLGGAFEHSTISGEADLTHNVDVRRIASGRGRYNIPNVGIFLWRLRSFALTRSPVVAAPDGNIRHLLFNPLSCVLPLFNLPATEDEVTHLAEPINVPDRIRRRIMKRNLDEYYGEGKSVLLELANPSIEIKPTKITSEKITICDLTKWINMPDDKIAIDPVLGRIALPASPIGLDLTRQMLATFHYGFSANMGGGEYPRLSSLASQKTEVLDDQGKPIVIQVANTFLEDAIELGVKTTISEALDDPDLEPKGGTVEILNSGRYVEKLKIDGTIPITNPTGKRIVLLAADKRRPTIVLSNELVINGGKFDEVILDGLLIVGGGIKVTGNIGRFVLRHCTLVPGISLDVDGNPIQTSTSSLIIESANARVEIDHCILGAVLTSEDAEVTVRDSIIDATAETKLAYGGTIDYGAPLKITNSTVIGRVRTSIMRLASNTIFLAAFGNKVDRIAHIAPVFAKRRQEGCVRFSYLSPGARVPVRYHCQPEPDTSFVRPRFVSTHFNDSAYCQLSASCSCKIRQGADDEAEMGAFHDLFEPQREAHLRARLDEYLRFGLEAGIIYVT